jgi:hypothetical protein
VALAGRSGIGEFDGQDLVFAVGFDSLDARIRAGLLFAFLAKDQMGLLGDLSPKTVRWTWLPRLRNEVHFMACEDQQYKQA